MFESKMSELVSGSSGSPVQKDSGPHQILGNGKPESPFMLLDRLSATRGIWEISDGRPEEAAELLSAQPVGTFIVTRNTGSDSMVLCLRTQESPAGPVGYFPIKESSTAVYLDGSWLRFRDILELLSFHLVSRDILPCQLRIPDALRLPRQSELDAIAALGTKFWTMPLKAGNGLALSDAEERPTGLNRNHVESSRPVCSIRVTSEDEALCIINPLFLSVHSDVSWLDLAPGLCRSSTRRGTLHFSNGQGSPLMRGTTQAASRKQGDQKCLIRRLGSQEQEEETGKGNPLPCSASEQPVPLLGSLTWSNSEATAEGPPLSPDPLQKEVKPPHRVSWVEEAHCWPLKKSASESSLISDSLLLPALPELDSLSVSSVEDEGEGLPLPTPASCRKHRGSSAMLTYKVLHRLSAVGSTLSGLLSTERRVSNLVQELAQEPTTYVGGLVQSFLSHVLQGAGSRHPTSTEMLQEVRQMISNLKGYLCESSELCAVYEPSEADEMDLGSVLEAALYKCILKPLRDSIYTQLLDFHTRDGTLGRLCQHQVTMRQQSLVDLGVTAAVPDAAGLERIQTKLSLMHQAYSPRKKEAQMLKICKMLYEAMSQRAGSTDPFGADDFLPVLIYVLVNSNIISVQLDVEYMMELMDPSQLQGEGGYYLTTWFGALYHIANFQPAAMVTRKISIEAQRSIHQWHRRRTIHHHHHQAKRRNSQNILYISFGEPFSKQKAISVPPDMTTASVCSVCAERYGIPNPEGYGLFLVTDDSWHLLGEDTYPQRLHTTTLQSPATFVSFVYKPKDGVSGPSSPPSSQKLNTLTVSQAPHESLGSGQPGVD